MNKNVIAIIPAAGIGERFLSNKPKQYFKIDQSTIIEKTVSSFIASDLISKIIIPINKNDDLIQDQDFFNNSKIQVVEGGNTRAESVFNALKTIDIKDYEYVITHDVARPNISTKEIELLCSHILDNNSDCSFFFFPITESIKEISNKKENTVDKNNYYLVQTPQISRSELLYDALEKCIESNINIPDESFVMEKMGYSISKIQGKADNIKITYPQDINLLKKFNTRTGTGFDLHTYKAGNGIILGGHLLECDYSVNAHSDGDVLLHSIADAILGASALGDIGIFFSDNDKNNKNLDSKVIIDFCLDEISKIGLEIFNIDATIICETPKISPARDAILDSLSKILRIDISQIGLKATTSEKIGIIGENKAIAVQTLVNLINKK